MANKIWVTKYALTKGIYPVVAHIEDDGYAAHTHGLEPYPSYYAAGTWYLTKEEALEKAEEQRLKRIKSLKKQLAKLQKMEIEVCDDAGK